MDEHQESGPITHPVVRLDSVTARLHSISVRPPALSATHLCPSLPFRSPLFPSSYAKGRFRDQAEPPPA